jgi:hypothetical protein
MLVVVFFLPWVSRHYLCGLQFHPPSDLLPQVDGYVDSYILILKCLCLKVTLTLSVYICRGSILETLCRRSWGEKYNFQHSNSLNIKHRPNLLPNIARFKEIVSTLIFEFLHSPGGMVYVVLSSFDCRVTGREIESAKWKNSSNPSPGKQYMCKKIMT